MGAPKIPSETRTTSTTEPYDAAIPYLEGGLSAVSNLYGQPGTAQFAQGAQDRITGFSAETEAGMNLTTQGALAGETFNDAARGASLSGLSAGAGMIGSAPNFGSLANSYVDPGTGMASYNLTPQDQAAMGVFGNQQLVTNDLLQRVMDPVQMRINEQAGAAGRTGSGLHQYALSRGLGDAVAPILYDAQTGALNRGAQIYESGSARAADMAKTAFGLGSQQVNQGSGLIQAMAGLQPSLNDATRSNAAALASVGGEREALTDAFKNAEYDQLTEYLQRIGYLSGFGGTTESQVGAVSGGGGGFGLSQGLGALIAGASLASGFGAFG